MAWWRTLHKWTAAPAAAAVLVSAGTAATVLEHRDPTPEAPASADAPPAPATDPRPGIGLAGAPSPTGPGVAPELASGVPPDVGTAGSDPGSGVPPDVPAVAASVLEAARSVLGLDAPPDGSMTPPPGDGAPSDAAAPAPAPHRAPGVPSSEVSAVAPGPAPAAAGSAAPDPRAAAARVEPGAGDCSGIEVSSRADPAAVQPGDEFTWIVTVVNPGAGELSRATLVHPVEATAGVAHTVVATDPAADSVSAASITFDNLGPIGAGRSETVRIRVRVEPGSAGGRFTGVARASGDCRPGTSSPAAGIVPVEGAASVALPEVAAVRGATLRRQGAATPRGAARAASPLPTTGGLAWGGAALGLMAAGTAARRIGRFAGSR